jgi:hypothetical protein
MTDEEVEAYIASQEYADYVSSPLFVERGVELDRRLASEPLTVEQAAEIVGFPVDVFRHIYGGHLAWETVKQQLGPAH